MKIQKTQEAAQTQQVLNTQDITELFFELKDEYRNVFIHQIDDQIFFYRSLGRKEYKEILENEQLDDLAKEEVICSVCTLWPENFDFENCDAGIPTVLAKAILKNSFLDSLEERRALMNYYRMEMQDIENQITCIINEAFPQYDIEEIESWDVEKTTKYLSRAEWKLHYLRNIPFQNGETLESFYEQMEKQQQSANKPSVETVELGSESESGGRKKKAKEKLTPEKLRELKQKYPEIPWEQDTILTEGVEGMADSVDITPPALRPGF